MKTIIIEGKECLINPCPFCGGLELDVQRGTEDREGFPTNLICACCGASGPWFYEMDDSFTLALEGWNKRHDKE